MQLQGFLIAQISEITSHDFQNPQEVCKTLVRVAGDNWDLRPKVLVAGHLTRYLR